MSEHNRQYLVQLVRMSHAMHKVQYRRRPSLRKRLPRQRQPDAARLSYYAELRSMMSDARQAIKERLEPELGYRVDAAAEVWLDAGAPGGVGRAMAEAARDFFNTFTNSRLYATAQRFGERVSAKQRAELQRQIRAGLGVDIGLEPDVSGPLDGFAHENVTLVRSMARRYFDEVEKKTVNAVRTGMRAEDLAQELQERYEVTQSHAKLIARDQIGKLYGELNQTRQENLGLTSYVWRTSNDERVRPEHAEREGERFDWSDPPEDGHPGMPIQCRCDAEPDLSQILEEL